MPSFIQPSFAKGEIAPALYGRVDTAAYQVALKTAKNCTIHAFGGVSNRAGLQFLAPLKQHTASGSRLIEFEFNTDDTYVLEFGDQYMRVIRNDAHVTETALTGCTATAADPVVVTKTTHGFSSNDEVYCSGFTEMTELNGRRFKITVLTADTFSLQDQVTGTDIDGSTWTAETTGGSVARIYEITTPYAIADLAELNYVQSADTMTLSHRSYEDQELTRTGHASWSIDPLSINPTQDHPTGLTVSSASGTGTQYRYKVTAIAQNEEESLSALDNTTETITGATAANPVVLTITGHPYNGADEIEVNGVVGMTELNGRRFRIVIQTANTVALQDLYGNYIDGTGYTAYSSGGTANRCFDNVSGGATPNNTISWSQVAGAARYSVYRETNGIFGFIGETEDASFTDVNITPDTDVTPPKFTEPFFGAGNYNQAAGYYEQRRVFGGSTNKPDTSNYSKTGNFSNFTKSNPTLADDAITATLNAQRVNAIRHFVPLNDLLILTSGAEWRINSGSAADGFTPDSLRQQPQSNWGSSYLKPIVSGTTVLFVQNNNAIVRSLGYSLQIDGYAGSNMTLLAHHLLQRRSITDWCYSRHPDPVVYMVRDDGKCLTMTFDQEQEVIAWTTWDTLGKFEACCAVQASPAAREESGYFIVKRKVNGNTVRYIEKVHSRNFDDVRDCFFVDSGLSYDSPVDITGATAANPVVITAVGHGFSNGDEVDIFDIEWEPDFDALDNETQPDQLNGRRYVVANKTTDTFELTDSDGNNIDGSAFNAYDSGGTVRLAVSSFAAYSFEHLAGKAVSVLADGNVIENKTIGADGSLSFDRKFSRYHIGLKYISDVETLPLEARTGTIQDKKLKVPRVTIKMERSRGLFIGNDTTDLSEMKFREFENMSDPTALYTGDKEFTMPPHWNDHGRILLRQRYPLPMTILAIVPDVTVGDR